MAAVASSLVLHFILARIAGSEDFKRFAEAKAGEYLKARVHIGKIRPYRLTQLALENILIEAPSAKPGSQLIRAERILFRYQFDQLWNKKLDTPAGVVMKNPAILIEQDQFPYRYFDPAPTGSSVFSIPSLDFKGGEIRYLFSSFGKEIVLRDVEGKILPSADKKVQVDIRARAGGMLEGRVRIHGSVDPVRKSHDLFLELEDIDVAPDIPIPLRSLGGNVLWKDQALRFEAVRGTLYGWNVELSGDLSDSGGHPRVTFQLQAAKGAPSFRWDVVLDLFEQRLAGSLELPDAGTISFQGKVRQERKRFIVDSLSIGPGYEGRGELDFASGNYELVLEKGSKRMAVHSNLQGLDFSLHFHFDHMMAFGLDLVTQGRIFFRSVAPKRTGRDLAFKGEFETDYFILDRQPFRDLKGQFDLGPGGVTGIRGSWGEQFRVTGQVTAPGKKPQMKLLLRVEDFDLGTVHTFAAKPLPKALGGRLDGQLSIEGPFSKPEVTGVFNIHDGKWGQLSYDRGIIQLRGFLPYLPLKESKIWKGRTVFYLNGALDLGLDNIFAGVKIQTPDNLVIWKGVEAALHEKDGTLELNRSKLGAWGELSLMEARSAMGSDPGRGASSGNDPDREEDAVFFGPKLKF